MLTTLLDKIMVFNFSLTQKLSLFFLLPEGQLCFWNFSLPHRKRSIHFGRVQESWRNSPCSERLEYQQIICWHSARKEKTDRVLFLKHGWDTCGGEYWTKMELNKFISNRVMHYIVPCGDIPSKTTNFSVDRYAVPYTSCYCIGHAPTSYRMLLYRACCCQIVFAVWYKCIQFHSCPVFPSIAQLLRYCGKRQKHITLEKGF